MTAARSIPGWLLPTATGQYRLGFTETAGASIQDGSELAGGIRVSFELADDTDVMTIDGVR